MRTQTLSESDYLELSDMYGGICASCGEFAYEGCEPDARHYKCDACGADDVFGIEQALLEGIIDIS